MRRRSILQLIAETAPQRPACFDSHPEWVEWLTSAHVGRERVVRRVDLGKHRGERVTYFEVLPVGLQGHCQDCTSIRKARMEAEGRCFPVRPREEVQRMAKAAMDGQQYRLPGFHTPPPPKPAKKTKARKGSVSKRRRALAWRRRPEPAPIKAAVLPLKPAAEQMELPL